MSESLRPVLTYYPMRQVLSVKTPHMKMFTHGLRDGLRLEYFQVGLGKETYADREQERKAVGLSKLPVIFTNPCGTNRLRFVTEQKRATVLAACQRT
ncbi:Hypothetical protein GSB_7538 [Giardia duodenalis]|uniref:Uncharacterized protein n=2 Tax=Giardia intestinalis TaxID=5741 RepID=C6LW72_GIAIB|nr:Hypothetical protein GL50581_3030 [Giardia intestinalis ATCC 50581]ESU42060.1 Hypothetical protein GSB_7538 [Giardia intestinalis]